MNQNVAINLLKLISKNNKSFSNITYDKIEKRAGADNRSCNIYSVCWLSMLKGG